MSEVTIENLEFQKEGLKEVIERGKLAEKLFLNRDFKKLILEDFCIKEAARYVHTSGDPSIDAVGRADALAMAQASGHLKRYLSVCVRMGQTAEKESNDIDTMLEEARQEDVNPEPYTDGAFE